uniref:Winged helix-turn-helix domain-containing protein n=1 Tax=Thermosporothrix sp. COM3 TaxID=2490863 RepID=A0A455SN83_9CHLR|nr:hypothetical protein KTC_39370 [Thermosporothrix sp. COM3]
MTVHLSLPQARQFLASYHFQPTTLPAIFEQLGTVQYDPLNPVGRNPDLVFQARIPGYQVDDWQTAAYQNRLIYDAWDKQACLVPVSDWPLRAIIRAHHRPYHDREILGLHPDLPRTIMAAIDSRGPLSSLEFEERARYGERNSWYGITQINRALRAMWVCGELLTHHRKNGRHYYDRPERVIPAKHFAQPLLADHDAYLRWIVARRIQAVGLLRLAADPAIWSVCGKAEDRKRVIAELLEEGTITQVTIETLKTPYYIPTSALPLLDTTSIPADRMRILGPLDNLLWDRKNLQAFQLLVYLGSLQTSLTTPLGLLCPTCLL